MATVESTIPSVLFARVAELALTSVLPVSYPDIPFTPPASAYLEVRHLPNSNVNLFVGDDAPIQYRGLLQITVVYPSGKGIVAPNEVAGKLVDHFKKGTVLRSGATKVRVYEKPSVAPSSQDTDRVRIPVTIKYNCFAP